MNDTKTGELLSKNIAGVNRILPHKHKYAWDLFLKSCANNWMPTEISMQNDIKQWKNNEITEDEKLLVKRCLGFFAGSELGPRCCSGTASPADWRARAFGTGRAANGPPDVVLACRFSDFIFLHKGACFSY